MTYVPNRFRRALAATTTPPASQPKKRKKAAPKPLPPLPASTWTGNQFTVILPVPVVALRPNGQHGHWRTIRKAKAAAKGLATLTTLQLLAGGPPPCATAYSLVYYFQATPWDDDNAIASVKAYLDGISSALGIDDRHLRFRELIRRADRKCPRLEIIMHLAASPLP